MSIDGAIAVLKSIAPVAAVVPVAGDGLAAMIGVATQVCEVAHRIKTNRQEYERLAGDVAGYASAVSDAVQSDPHFLLGSENGIDQQEEATKRQISELTDVFSQIAETILNSREEEHRPKGTLLGARQYWRRIRSKNEDEEKIKTP